MRNVVQFLFVSLDGVAEEPSDWFFETGPELFDLIGRVTAAQDDVLLGRRTYDYWAGYWPTSDVEPFASFINNTPKHVASSTALTTPWANATRIDGSVEDHIRALKQQPGRDIGIHGSIELGRSLIAAGLVDELRLVIPPVIAGHGARLFTADAGLPLQRLQLIDLERTELGTLFLHYRVPIER